MELIQQLVAWQGQLDACPAAEVADLDVAKRLLAHGIQAAGEIVRLRAVLERIADPWSERQDDDPATIIHLARIARAALAPNAKVEARARSAAE